MIYNEQMIIQGLSVNASQGFLSSIQAPESIGAEIYIHINIILQLNLSYLHCMHPFLFESHTDSLRRPRSSPRYDSLQLSISRSVVNSFKFGVTVSWTSDTDKETFEFDTSVSVSGLPEKVFLIEVKVYLQCASHYKTKSLD